MKKYDITGMSCAACSARVEKAVSSVKGVTSCQVNLLTNNMTVEGSATDEDIINAVTHAGYGVITKEGTDNNNKENKSNIYEATTRKLLKRLITSLGLLLVLMYISMGHMMFHFPLPNSKYVNNLSLAITQFILATIILYINRKFFINGFKGAYHLSPNMDTLVALGSGISYIYSLIILYSMTANKSHSLYFESAAMIVTLITLGKLLESYSKGKTTNALNSLYELRPDIAHVLRDNNEITIKASDMKIGEIFIVRPGEKVPADGIVTEGESAVDESALTGESMPVDKNINDEVSASTTNQTGVIKCKSTRVGNDTTFSKVIELVEQASSSKAKIARIADKVAGVFVPFVLIIATLTFTIWTIKGMSFSFSLSRAISVLVISCPCALGLATPVAIMVATGKGAKNKILYKNATSLEICSKAKTVIFDKTGTITEGKPKVTDIIPIKKELSKEGLLKLSYLLERMSEHPLAHAIVNTAESMYPDIKKDIVLAENFESVTGNGLKGKILSYSNEYIYAGSISFAEKTLTRLKTSEDIKAYKDITDKLSSEGKTPVIIFTENNILGIIAIADTIRKESAYAVKTLTDMGIRCIMLTGDNLKTANKIASEAGISEVIAEVLPDEKADTVNKLKKDGICIMVGDGINDAPALATADIGMSVSSGSDIARDSSSIILMDNSIMRVPDAITLSRKTMLNIKENLFWAFFYNIICIPIAAGCYYHSLGLELSPMLGALAMSLSSFFVVCNALRLNFVKLNTYKSDDVNNANNANNANKSFGMEGNMTKEIKIKGMMCNHCESTVKKALEALDNVVSAEVSHEKGNAIIEITADVDNSLLKKTIEEKDYEVTEII